MTNGKFYEIVCISSKILYNYKSKSNLFYIK